MDNWILIDIDGVCAAFVEGFLPALNTAYGTNFKPEDVTRYDMYDALFLEPSRQNGRIPIISKDEYKAFFKGWECYGYWNLEPVKWAYDGIYSLMESGNLIKFITCRSEAYSNDTYDWFDKKLNTDCGDIIFCTDKIPHLKPGDILIEDDPTTAVRAAEVDITTILLDAPYNRQIREYEGNEIIRVSNWSEIVSLLGAEKARGDGDKCE